MKNDIINLVLKEAYTKASSDGINLKLLREMNKLESKYKGFFSFSKLNYPDGDYGLKCLIGDKDKAEIALSFDPYDLKRQDYPISFYTSVKRPASSNIRIDEKTLTKVVEKLALYYLR